MVRPIILKGHDRPVSQVMYNREGDLLFSASKGKNMNCAVWFAETGERIGTYDGHNGAVFCMDVDFHSRFLLTASGDSTTAVWEVATGKRIVSFEHDTPACWVNWALGDKKFLTVTKGVMGKKPYIHIYEMEDPYKMRGGGQAKMKIEGVASITHALWGPLNKNIYASHNDGSVVVYNDETGEVVKKIQAHDKEITTLKFSRDKNCFITASKDNTCKMYDTKTCECIKTFVAGKPFYDAVISPIMPHVFVVGGQDVSTVTTAIADSAQFRARIFHTIYATEIGSIAGHFAPVNSITLSPDGKTMVTGGEDGYVRVNPMDNSYFKGMSDEVLFPMGGVEEL